MRTAVVAFGDVTKGDDAIGIEIVSKIRQPGFPAGVVPFNGGAEVLKTLEKVSGFDGLVIVDAASMGRPPGAFIAIGVNDLIMKHRLMSLKLHGMKIDSELIYAHKYLDLPPTRLVLIQPEILTGQRISETLSSRVVDYLEAVRRAIDQLEPCS